MPLRIVLEDSGTGQEPGHHFDCIHKNCLVAFDKDCQQGNWLDFRRQLIGTRYVYLHQTIPVKNPHVRLCQTLTDTVIHYKLPLCWHPMQQCKVYHCCVVLQCIWQCRWY